LTCLIVYQQILVQEIHIQIFKQLYFNSKQDYLPSKIIEILNWPQLKKKSFCI